MRKESFIFVLLFMTLAMLACKQPMPFDNFDSHGDLTDKTSAVAIVTNDTITLEQFNQGLNDDGFHRKDFTDTIAFKAETLKRLILDRAARQKAPAYPLEIDEDLQLQLDDHLNTTLRFQLFENEILPKVEVSNEEIEKFYEDNKESYKVKASAKVAQILAAVDKRYLEEHLDLDIPFTKEVCDSLARAKMDIIVSELESGRPFEDVAREYSDDSVSAQNGGLLNFPIFEGDAAYYFDSVVFKEPIDTFHGPVKTTYGYHMVKVYERDTAYYYALDSALKASIRERFEKEKSQQLAALYFDSLYKASNFQFNDAFTEEKDSLLSDDDWAIIIDSADTVNMFIFREYENREKHRLQRPILSTRIKQELLSKMANLWLLSFESKKLGYEKTEKYEKAKIDFLNREKLKHLRAERAPKNPEPTEEEMHAYYELHPEEFAEDTMISIQQLVVSTKAVAEEFKTRVDNGENFQWAAMDYAQGETDDIKLMTINLGWISPDEISRDFFEKIYAYDVDSVTPPIETDWGWHVVKILGKTGIKDFRDVKVKIRREMMDRRREEANAAWEKQILDGLDIRIDYDLFKNHEFNVDWLPHPDLQKMTRGF